MKHTILLFTFLGAVAPVSVCAQTSQVICVGHPLRHQ